MNAILKASLKVVAQLLPCAVFFTAVERGFAQDSWTGGGTPTAGQYLWSDPNNWTDGVPSDGATETITFSGTTGLNSYEDIVPPANSYAYFVGGINFDSTAGAYTLSGLQFALFGSADYSGAINNNSSSTITIDNDIVLGNDSGLAANSSGDLVLNGNINDNGHSLGFLANSTGAVTQTGVVSGNGNFVVFDGSSANIYVNGNNTYSGQTLIFGGTVNLGSSVIAGQNGALGNVAQASGNEFIQMGATTAPGLTASLLTNGNDLVIERDINIVSPTSGTSNMTIGNAASGTSSTLSGVITLGSAYSAAQGVTLTAASNSQFIVSGNIQKNTGITGSGDTVTKTGAGVVQLSGLSNYQGGTTVMAGTLLVTGTAYQAGAYTVQSGASLGGAGGTINTSGAGVTLQAGAGLDISGQRTGYAITPGTLTLNLSGGALDLSQAVTGSSGLLSFALATPSTSDQVLLGSGSALNIGSGLLGLNDFSFTTKTGFGAGQYVLFDTSSPTAISGSLGLDLTGFVGDYSATLAEGFDNSGNQDIFLDVTAVPEPSEMALFLSGLLVLVVVMRRKQNS